MTVDLATLQAGSFRAHQGDRFAVAGDGDLALVLERVEGAGESGREGGAFSLIFRGPAAPVLAQGVHRLDHPGMGAMEIFVVPLSAGAGGAVYQAVFA